MDTLLVHPCIERFVFTICIGMKGVDEKCYIGDVKNLHYDLHQDIRDLEELFLDDMVENLDEIARAYGVLSERYLPVDLGFIR